MSVMTAAMPSRILLLAAACCGAMAGARLPEWYTRQLPDAEFRARIVRELGEIERIAGDRFDGQVILVEVEVRPLYGSQLQLRRDDFLVRARNDNDTSLAQSPDRIAGGAVLELGKKTSSSAGGVFADNTSGGVWGGAPGTGGRPRRLPGPPNVGGGGARTEERRTARLGAAEDGSVAGRLAALELPLRVSGQPASGYLYFEIQAKTKRKHLELSYDGELGSFLIEFKRPE